MSKIKSFKVMLELEALINSNQDFPDNAFAIESVAVMITEAISFNLKTIDKIKFCKDKDAQKDADLIDYLEKKISTYEKIRNSLI